MYCLILDFHGVPAIRAAEKYWILAEEFRDVCNAINSYIQNPIIAINDVEYTLENSSYVLTTR